MELNNFSLVGALLGRPLPKQMKFGDFVLDFQGKNVYSGEANLRGNPIKLTVRRFARKDFATVNRVFATLDQYIIASIDKVKELQQSENIPSEIRKSLDQVYPTTFLCTVDKEGRTNSHMLLDNPAGISSPRVSVLFGDNYNTVLKFDLII